mgnify:CR=1 FL=1
MKKISYINITALSFNRPLSLSKGKVNSHYMHFVTLTSTSSASGFIQMLTVCITSNNTVQMKEPWDKLGKKTIRLVFVEKNNYLCHKINFN